MIDPPRVLQPLAEAGEAVDELTEYESPEALASAIERIRDALERSLRRLLRSDTRAPDALRLAALSRAELPFDRLVEALRRRELISLELAGLAHETEQAARRASQGGVRAADADAVRGAVERLRVEVQALGERPIREAARHAVTDRILEEPPRPVPPSQPRDRSFGRLAAAISLFVLLGLAVVLVLSLNRSMNDAIAAFEAGRLELAERRFGEIVEENPENVTALLYLARIHRRGERYDEAADALRTAVRESPGDADVRRELGHLLLELGRPAAAAEQYRRAVEFDPEESMNWLGLVRALRAAGDPQAEEVLRRAPADVRALLTTGG